jgi:hypothetical protein
MEMIIGRCLTPFNCAKTMGSVRRRDDNSRGSVPNVRGDSSVLSRETEHQLSNLMPHCRATDQPDARRSTASRPSADASEGGSQV